jgi:hypothetical protein
MAAKFIFHENIIIEESDIIELLDKIGKINGYGDFIKGCCMDSDKFFTVIFANEVTMLDNPDIKSITHSRGHQISDTIVIHCTRYETIDSIKWIFLHELAHFIFDSSLFIMSVIYFIREKYYKDIKLCHGDYEYYYEDKDLNEKYVSSDEIHENDPEEKLANDFATHLIGYDYSRSWWRKNIEIIDKQKI